MKGHHNRCLTVIVLFTTGWTVSAEKHARLLQCPCLKRPPQARTARPGSGNNKPSLGRGDSDLLFVEISKPKKTLDLLAVSRQGPVHENLFQGPCSPPPRPPRTTGMTLWEHGTHFSDFTKTCWSRRVLKDCMDMLNVSQDWGRRLGCR